MAGVSSPETSLLQERIETIAQRTLSGLEQLKRDMDSNIKAKDFLAPKNGSERAVENLGFVNGNLLPIAREYISETKENVYIAGPEIPYKGEEEREGGRIQCAKNGLTIDYWSNDGVSWFPDVPLTPELLQELGNNNNDIKRSMKELGQMSKKQLIDRFQSAVENGRSKNRKSNYKEAEFY